MLLVGARPPCPGPPCNELCAIGATKQERSPRSRIRAIQLLLGHAKLESAVRYLGIEVDDALEISERIEI